MAHKYYQNWFKAKNPSKYKGNPSQIAYRSSWELRYMVELDTDPNVIQWASEEIIIPYRSPVDGKPHRYFCDFWVKRKGPDGKLFCEMIEIKPSVQTKPPKVTAKRNKRALLNEQKTFAVNSAKWEAATEFCLDRGWTFRIVTEKELRIKS